MTLLREVGVKGMESKQGTLYEVINTSFNLWPCSLNLFGPINLDETMRKFHVFVAPQGFGWKSSNQT